LYLKKNKALLAKMGKKSRKASSTKKLSNSDRKNPASLKSVIDFVSHCLKLADEEKLPLEHYFSHHRHSVSSCDGDGAFNLISLFVSNPSITVPGTPERSAITTICMRVHDNVRNTMIIPNDASEWINAGAHAGYRAWKTHG
jgi:hypothetical protein